MSHRDQYTIVNIHQSRADLLDDLLSLISGEFASLNAFRRKIDTKVTTRAVFEI